MNIKDLTVRDLRRITALTSALDGRVAVAPEAHPLIGRSVLVRDNRAGVHCGTLITIDIAGHTCALKDARKIHYWVGAASCHGIAVRGIKDGSRVAPVVERVDSFDVVEIVAMTAEAAEQIADFEEWCP